MTVYIYPCSARNKDQKLVGHFSENRYFLGYWLLSLLKMYRKFGRPKWILVGQMLKLVRNGQWPTVISSTAPGHVIMFSCTYMRQIPWCICRNMHTYYMHNTYTNTHHTHEDTHSLTHNHTHTRMYTHARTRTHTHARTHPHTHTHMHAQTHKRTHTYQSSNWGYTGVHELHLDKSFWEIANIPYYQL